MRKIEIEEEKKKDNNREPTLKQKTLGRNAYKYSNNITSRQKEAIIKKRSLGLQIDIYLLVKIISFLYIYYLYLKALDSYLGLIIKILKKNILYNQLLFLYKNKQRLG